MSTYIAAVWVVNLDQLPLQGGDGGVGQVLQQQVQALVAVLVL